MVVPRNKLIEYVHKTFAKALKKRPEMISIDIDLRGDTPKVVFIVSTKTEDIEDFE